MKLMFKLYSLLLKHLPFVDNTKIWWGKDLMLLISDSAWLKLQKFNLIFSSNVSIMENRFKVMQHWYLTPSHLAKFFSQSGRNCWHCGNVKGDYLHMWWACKKLEQFWKSARAPTEEIIQIKLPLCPRIMLLLDFEYGGIVAGKELLAHMLTVASLLIAKQWKSEVKITDLIEKLRIIRL